MNERISPWRTIVLVDKFLLNRDRGVQTKEKSTSLVIDSNKKMIYREYLMEKRVYQNYISIGVVSLALM